MGRHRELPGHGGRSPQASCGYPPPLFPTPTVFPSGTSQDPRARALGQPHSRTLRPQTAGTREASPLLTGQWGPQQSEGPLQRATLRPFPDHGGHAVRGDVSRSKASRTERFGERGRCAVPPLRASPPLSPVVCAAAYRVG